MNYWDISLSDLAPLRVENVKVQITNQEDRSVHWILCVPQSRNMLYILCISIYVFL